MTMLTNETPFVINANGFGLILGFVDPSVDMPLWKQIHENYSHGGGWSDMEKFVVTDGGPDTPYIIQYPKYPPMYEMGRLGMNGQRLILFDYSIVLWTDDIDINVSENNSINAKIARID
jgi:hypothetical protein